MGKMAKLYEELTKKGKKWTYLLAEYVLFTLERDLADVFDEVINEEK